jgi:serine phosphatase RsbU (regulator of sigma subunit)
MITQATYETTTVKFGRGDRMIIYSDGLTEMTNADGEQFSEKRLADFIATRAPLSTTNLLGELNATLRSWRGSDALDDDLTVLMLERSRERPSNHDFN